MSFGVSVKINLGAALDVQAQMASSLAKAVAAATADMDRTLADAAGGSDLIDSRVVEPSGSGSTSSVSVGWSGVAAASAASIDHGSVDGSVPAQPFMDRALHAGVRAVDEV